jgi:hypothetical protein
VQPEPEHRSEPTGGQLRTRRLAHSKQKDRKARCDEDRREAHLNYELGVGWIRSVHRRLPLLRRQLLKLAKSPLVPHVANHLGRPPDPIANDVLITWMPWRRRYWLEFFQLLGRFD